MFNLNKLRNMQLNTQFITKFLANLLTNVKVRWLYKKNIVILFGSKGVFLSAFIKNKLAESLFIPFTDSIDLNLYKSFFHKFKNSDVFFLLDGAECKMRHDSIPILQSIVKTNPIEQFINGYFNKDDIIAHYVYKRTTTPSEFWSTLIMSSPYQPPLSDIGECVFENKSLAFKGIYFLALEFKTILDKIIKNTQQNKYADYFQICVFILEASGIKFIIKHQDNIISMRTFEYPPDKSESYIQGIIEQEINDCLLLFKNYIGNLNNEACIILIVEPELQTLLQQSNFENHPVIFIPMDGILNEVNLTANKFLDANISKLFIKYKNFRATNTYLKSIEKLNFIGSLIFKLFSFGMIILLIIAGATKYKTFQNNKASLFFSEKYYATTQQYDEIKYKYPYIQNTTNLADLYVIEKLLEAPVTLPFDLLEKYITTLGPPFQLKEITWELTDVDNILLMSKRYLNVRILLNFTTANLSVTESINKLNDHIKLIQDTMADENIKLNITVSEDKIINTSGKVVIPLFIKYSRKG